MDDNQDIRPRPDPTTLTTAALDREIGHLKELMSQDRAHLKEMVDKDRDAQQKALEVALTQMDRRLSELNELRKSVEKDRVEFVRTDVYAPAHEELRRQRVADGEKIVTMQSDIKTNATNFARLESSVMWLSRLVISAVILALIAFGFRMLVGR